MSATALTVEQLSEKLQYLFRGLSWLHGKATRYLLVQLFMVTAGLLSMYLYEVSLFVTIPYIIFSAVTVSACALLFTITQGAADLEDNINEMKAGASDTSSSISKTKPDVSKDAFQVKKLLKHAKTLSTLHAMKGVSLDIKDSALSLVRVFTPFTGILLVGAAVTSFVQVFITILSIIFIVPV
jgi:hypothetical protein